MTDRRLTYSADEVAALLDCSKWTVYAAVRAGSIPTVGVGKTVRIPKRWVNDRIGDSGGITPDPDELNIPVSAEVLDRLISMATSVADLTGSAFDLEIAAGLRLHRAHVAAASSAPRTGRAGAELGTATEPEPTVDGTRKTVDGRAAPAQGRGRLALAVPPS